MVLVKPQWSDICVSGRTRNPVPETHHELSGEKPGDEKPLVKKQPETSPKPGVSGAVPMASPRSVPASSPQPGGSGLKDPSPRPDSAQSSLLRPSTRFSKKWEEVLRLPMLLRARLSARVWRARSAAVKLVSGWILFWVELQQ